MKPLHRKSPNAVSQSRCAPEVAGDLHSRFSSPPFAAVLVLASMVSRDKDERRTERKGMKAHLVAAVTRRQRTVKTAGRTRWGKQHFPRKRAHCTHMVKPGAQIST